MKTLMKFLLQFPILALASGSIAFAQAPIPPVTPADSAAKAAALGPTPAGAVNQMVAFPSGSRWHVTLNAIRKYGLVVTGASFQKSPSSPFVYVLFDGRLGEIFVPYHTGDPRYGDISDYNFDPLTLNQADYPPPRHLIGDNKICKEVREYLAWMNATREPTRVRYGKEVIYFSVLDAGNYAYIMEWTFRDDGVIQVRAGSTGPKLEWAPKRGHMHNFTWRLDIDLDGAGGDKAYLTSHYEDLTAQPGSTATDEKDLVSIEGGYVWNPQNFNTLVIEDSALKNSNDRRTSYELVPSRGGNARHTEQYTKKDFWVSRYNPTQSFLAKGLPDYVRDKQSTVNQDLVIWYTGSEHHENDSRDEDKDTVPILWTGFDLVPNNLFNRTPFYP